MFIFLSLSQPQAPIALPVVGLNSLAVKPLLLLLGITLFALSGCSGLYDEYEGVPICPVEKQHDPKYILDEVDRSFEKSNKEQTTSP